MVDRHGGQHYVRGIVLVDQRLGSGLIKLIAVGEHGAFGEAGGAAGELQEAHVVHRDVR